MRVARKPLLTPHLEMSEERDSWRDLSHVFLRRRCGCGLSLSSVAVSRSQRPRDLAKAAEQARALNGDARTKQFH